MGAGGAAEHGRLAPHPAPPRAGDPGRRAAAVRGPAVAGEPVRGLPDRPRARAGADREGGTRPLIAARLGRLRERMAGAGFDAVIVGPSADYRWLTDLHPPIPTRLTLAIVPLHGDPVI